MGWGTPSHHYFMGPSPCPARRVGSLRGLSDSFGQTSKELQVLRQAEERALCGPFVTSDTDLSLDWTKDWFPGQKCGLFRREATCLKVTCSETQVAADKATQQALFWEDARLFPRRPLPTRSGLSSACGTVQPQKGEPRGGRDLSHLRCPRALVLPSSVKGSLGASHPCLWSSEMPRKECWSASRQTLKTVSNGMPLGPHMPPSFKYHDNTVGESIGISKL